MLVLTIDPTDPLHVLLSVELEVPVGATPLPLLDVQWGDGEDSAVTALTADHHYVTAGQYLVVAQWRWQDVGLTSYVLIGAGAEALSVGELVATLPTLRAYLGMQTDRDDVVLQQALNAATSYLQSRVMEAAWTSSDVQLAVLMVAARLYARRRSPEGVAGFAADGLVVRIVAQDPDIYRLLEWSLDMAKAGVA